MPAPKNALQHQEGPQCQLISGSLADHIDEDAEDEYRDAAPQQKGENGVRPSRIGHDPVNIRPPKHTHGAAPPPQELV